MASLTAKEKKELNDWLKKIYFECDEEEMPDVFLDHLYEIAKSRGEVPELPEDILPTRMPFGKYKGSRISEITNTYYLETLLCKQWKTMDKYLLKALKKQWQEMDSMDDYIAGLESDYSDSDFK